jgi:hypothetical protein
MQILTTCLAFALRAIKRNGLRLYYTVLLTERKQVSIVSYSGWLLISVTWLDYLM